MDRHLIYIRKIGEKLDGNIQYELYFTMQENLKPSSFSEEYDATPYCLNHETNMVEGIRTKKLYLETKVKLSLIQDNCCMSFKNCVDQVCALGYEDISEYEEYPEEGRLFFMFNELEETVTEKLKKKQLQLLEVLETNKTTT